jgi:alkanesulfonate monooxygenase SsuD/methylene tetrahydromethanopterin reductase-like flavin-dependent oxidoreductase (luciferase family)
MWSDDDGSFEGKHYRLAETLCSPKPLGRPRPRLIVCGGGERKTLRLAARYADESNVIARSPDEVARKLEVLRAHCEQVGRDPGEIAKSVLYVGDALVKGVRERFVEEMRPFAALGVDTVVVMPLVEQPIAFVERLGTDVVPALAEL